MAIKLHRCSNLWVKISGHPCWKVQKALDEQGIEYEIVKGPLRTGKREARGMDAHVTPLPHGKSLSAERHDLSDVVVRELPFDYAQGRPAVLCAPSRRDHIAPGQS